MCRACCWPWGLVEDSENLPCPLVNHNFQRSSNKVERHSGNMMFSALRFQKKRSEMKETVALTNDTWLIKAGLHTTYLFKSFHYHFISFPLSHHHVLKSLEILPNILWCWHLTIFTIVMSTLASAGGTMGPHLSSGAPGHSVGRSLTL